MNYNQAIQVVLCILFILLIFHLLYRVHVVKVYRFYRPTCGYCVSSQDEWNKFKRQRIADRLEIVDINMDKSDALEQDIAKNFGVPGVPHIVAVKPDGRKYVYQGPRTAAALHQWIDLI